MTYILRIVPAGEPAANVADNESVPNFTAPMDLVLLTTRAVDDGDGVEEVEVERESHATGRAAHARLLGMLQR